MSTPAIIDVTPEAADRIRVLLDQRETPSEGVRVGVKSGGCSGLSYVIEYANEVQDFDEVVALPDDPDYKIIIDAKAVMYLMGSQMDYVEEQWKSGFVFKNPNEKGTCGCGESFHV